jgi:hypothetical protein
MHGQKDPETVARLEAREKKDPETVARLEAPIRYPVRVAQDPQCNAIRN